MKINRIAIGNNEESFIEDRFSDKVNVIYSDDNNKGKTIVMQGIMYALGNSPIFPNTFNYQDYYYIVDIEVNSQTFSICRKKDSFLIKHKNKLNICDSPSDFKYYFDKNIYKLPEIIKDNKSKLVDIELFVQLFFLGQDRKDTSNIFNSGYYKKEDFIKMLFAFAGITTVDKTEQTEKEIKDKLAAYASEKRLLLSKYKILKKLNKNLSVANYTNDRIAFEKTIVKLEELKNKIVELKNKRNRAINRKMKNEEVLKEMISLNKSLDVGKIVCGDCGSENIKFVSASQEYSFDISSSEIRVQVKKAIEDKISIYAEEIEKLSIQINIHQLELKEELKESDITIEDILLFKNDITLASDTDARIKAIDKEVDMLKSLQKTIVASQDIDETRANQLMKDILTTTNKIYKEIDPKGNLNIDALFTKRNTVYSGSEGTEFYLSKLISLLANLKHEFPIIVDSFREGELSTAKEKIVLKIFNDFNNQIILTATLKTQELGKYDSLDWINKIDYSIYQPSKLLQPTYNERFKLILDNFQK